MLPYPDRFQFKSAPPRASRLMFVWFVFLLLVAVLSVGMLVTAMVQAAEIHRAPARLSSELTDLHRSPSYTPYYSTGSRPCGARRLWQSFKEDRSSGMIKFVRTVLIHATVYEALLQPAQMNGRAGQRTSSVT